MFWAVSNILNKSLSEKQWEIPKIAAGRIALYKLTTNDLLLEKYIYKKYKKSLKNICYNLIYNNLKINTDYLTKTVIITFKNEESDKLASLITYGNEQTPGSFILQDAFDQSY